MIVKYVHYQADEFFPMPLVTDPFAHNLQSFTHHNEGSRIDFTDHFLKARKLCERNDGVKNMQWLPGVPAGTLHDRHAPLQFFHYLLGNLFPSGGNDHDGLALAEPDDDQVNDIAVV